MGFKKFIKDITGATAREEKARADDLARLDLVMKANEAMIKQQKAEARKKEKAEKKRREAEAEARLTPKELATKRKEPWVDAQLNVNQDDIRYGFYEIDWNEYWVLKLKQEGYGADGDPDEEIVARWFRDISAFVAAEEGVNITNSDVGYINIVKRNDGKSEVS